MKHKITCLIRRITESMLYLITNISCNFSESLYFQKFLVFAIVYIVLYRSMSEY